MTPRMRLAMYLVILGGTLIVIGQILAHIR